MSQLPQHTAASADEVIALLRTICRPLEAERVALSQGLGCVLREPVCAPGDQPPFDRSSMDGYAVRLDDPATQFRIVDEIRAGDWRPRPLQPGEAVRIATGGALPCDGLQVVMKEHVEVEGAIVRVTRRDADRNIRFRGEDARAGQVLVETGTVLLPGTLALLASIGCTQPSVTRLPRVVHAVTGNEIVAPEETPQAGQIRDSNSTLVRAFLQQWRVEPVQLRLPEDEVRATATLQSLVSPVGDSNNSPAPLDLLLISGGASVGEHDFTSRLIEGLGYTIRVSKTNTRPGKPLILGQRGNTLAFGLPGNPLAHFVCLNLYLRVALEAWSGLKHRAVFRRGVLASELDAGGGPRETFWPARCLLHDEMPSLVPLRWASSGDLTSLATADALIRVGGSCGRLARGAPVEFASTILYP